MLRWDWIGVYSFYVWCVYGAAYIISENMRWRNKDEPMLMDAYCAISLKEKSEGELEPCRIVDIFSCIYAQWCRLKNMYNYIYIHTYTFTANRLNTHTHTHTHQRTRSSVWKLNGFSLTSAGRVYKATMETIERNFHVHSQKKSVLMINYNFRINLKLFWGLTVLPTKMAHFALKFFDATK